MKKNIKRLLCLALALVMLLTLAACGKDDDTETTEATEKKPKHTEPADKDTQPTTEPDDRTVLTASLWELTYDEEAGWIYDEEYDFQDSESYSNIRLKIPKADNSDTYSIIVSIQVSLTDVTAFREDLVYYGLDEYEYAVNDAYPTLNIGGVECVRCEYVTWGVTELYYLGRDEASRATITIEVDGEIEDSRVDELLAGLRMTLTDIGNVDAPWYWDGEPFTGESHETTVGDYTLQTTWIPFDESICTYEIFEHKAAVYGEVAYVLTDGVLYRYAFDGTSLTYPEEIPLEKEYKNMDLGDGGLLWLSNFICPLLCVDNTEVIGSYSGTDYAAVAPSGTWGISWFTGPEYDKFTLSDGTLTSEELTFSETKSISRVLIDDSSIYVCGSAADGSGHKVFVYDYSGNLQLTLDDGEGGGFGSITYVARMANGFIGLDGNMRRVVLWDKDGGYIGEVDDYDLFGTGYPWFCDGCKLDDGSLLVIMTEDRDDGSATELIAFKISGF